MRFFSQFPKVNYDINDQAVNTSLIDIYRHVGINKELIDDITNYTYYTIKDGERPDVVSYKLYDTPEYHWTFFIINETLKTGLNGWPRTYNEQVSYIEKRYDEYSVLEFLPYQSDVLEGIKYNNYFNAIDFDDENVILKRYDDRSITASIESYDSDKLQLWVKDLSSSSFLGNEELSYVIGYDKDASTITRDTWLTNIMLPFVENNHPDIYESLINDTRLTGDIILPYIRGSIDGSSNILDPNFERGTAEIIFTDDDIPLYSNNYISSYGYDYNGARIIDLLYNDYLDQIQFTTKRSWLKSYNAPYSYYNNDEEELSTYDALKQDPDSGNYITYAQAEDDLNESRTKIRVLRPSEVEGFAEYYNELLNE